MKDVTFFQIIREIAIFVFYFFKDLFKSTWKTLGVATVVGSIFGLEMFM
jgi:hypothetical protein